MSARATLREAYGPITDGAVSSALDMIAVSALGVNGFCRKSAPSAKVLIWPASCPDINTTRSGPNCASQLLDQSGTADIRQVDIGEHHVSALCKTECFRSVRRLQHPIAGVAENGRDQLS